MKYTIRRSKVTMPKDVENYIKEKIGKLEKYFNNGEDLTANILVKSGGKDKYTVEVTIPVKKLILRAEETNIEINACIDLIIDKLERQIRKNKTRIKKSKNKINDFITDYKIEKEEKDTSKIVKRKATELKPMSEEEAILQMNLIDHSFFIYRNAKNGEIEVIYKRNDGNYGIIKEK